MFDELAVKPGAHSAIGRVAHVFHNTNSLCTISFTSASFWHDWGRIWHIVRLGTLGIIVVVFPGNRRSSERIQIQPRYVLVGDFQVLEVEY